MRPVRQGDRAPWPPVRPAFALTRLLLAAGIAILLIAILIPTAPHARNMDSRTVPSSQPAGRGQGIATHVGRVKTYPRSAPARVPPAGRKDRMKEMSEYPFYIKGLDQRWRIARKSLKSDKPNVSYVAVLARDLDDVHEALHRSYHKPNRNQAVARAAEIAKAFRADLAKRVDMHHGSVVLLKHVTAEDVAKTVEKTYKTYLEFRAMIQLD